MSTSHMKDTHIHQSWWTWAEPDNYRPGKYLLIDQCSVCPSTVFVSSIGAVPDGVATEPPPEADGVAWQQPVG